MQTQARTSYPQVFRILAVGSSGAGKTVYMASMFRQLRLKRPDTVFFLTAEPSQSLQLNSIFNQVCDPEGDWPLASSTVQEWTFTTQINTRTASFTPICFSYLDYPGSVLTNPRAAGSEAGRTVSAQLHQADALLVLLDGQCVLGMVKGDASGRTFAETDLVTMLEIVQQADCPVHFVISKWDLVSAADVSLADARLALEAVPSFVTVIDSLAERSGAPIRLIPVSSVGPGYAVVHPDGSMAKIAGARPSPLNVEIPLMAVLPDFIQTQCARIDKACADFDSRRKHGPMTNDSASSLAHLVGRFTNLVVPPLEKMLITANPKVGKVLGQVDGKTLAGQITAFAEAMVMRGHMALLHHFEERQAELENRRRAATTAREAAALIQVQFVESLNVFDTENPGAVLAGSSETFLSDVATLAGVGEPTGATS